MELVKKIDMHAHAWRNPGPPLPRGYVWIRPEELMEAYDRLGVEKGVLLPLVSPESVYSIVTSETVEEIVDQYPDRFFWFCSVDPRVLDNSLNSEVDYLVRYYKERGAKGLGEITANIAFDDPRVYRLLAACEKYDMPITIHIGHTDGAYGLIDELGLPRLEKVLQTFPNLKVLGHSQRFWSHIGSDVTEETRHGFPSGKVGPGGRVVELMRKYPNLYGDMSALSGYNAITRDPEFGYAFLEEFQDKLFFGVDMTSFENLEGNSTKLSAYLDDAVLNGKISQDVYYKVSRGNALKLLGE